MIDRNLKKADAEKYLKESQAIETRANSIASVTDSLSDQVNKMNSSVNSMKDSSEEDTDAVNNAAAKASRAKDNADEALSKIKKALDTVNEINNVLDNLDSQKINTTHLDILEQEIINVENLMRSNDIDNQMKMIKEALKKLTESEDNFTRELTQLRADVKNIEDINNSLPKGCFKPLNLEKTK
eukprot:XP_014767870.1 PREDICTED: laminin subunit gamma-1-like [Octopus bimaculoides]